MDANQGQWDKVDAYVGERLGLDDEALVGALQRTREGGLPDIQVSAAQGRLLTVLAMAVGAEMVLEIGTLGGYSTICLARGVREGGRVVTLELEMKHAEVARENVDAAGVGDRVEIRVGAALDTLAMMKAEEAGPFDMAFIDADKANIPAYVDRAVGMMRQGGLIVVDNVVREGALVDGGSDDPSTVGVRALRDMLAKDARLVATTIQTVGAKGWDGLTVAVVR